jgi:hypothetical protein
VNDISAQQIMLIKNRVENQPMTAASFNPLLVSAGHSVACHFWAHMPPSQMGR